MTSYPICLQFFIGGFVAGLAVCLSMGWFMVVRGGLKSVLKGEGDLTP